MKEMSLEDRTNPFILIKIFINDNMKLLSSVKQYYDNTNY